MTREEIDKIASDYLNDCESELDMLEVFVVAKESLEQETVLDKIRVEIEALDDGISNYHDDRPWIFKDEALDIIDKYRYEVNHETDN